MLFFLMAGFFSFIAVDNTHPFEFFALVLLHAAVASYNICLLGLVISLLALFYNIWKQRKRIALRYAVYIAMMIPSAVVSLIFFVWHITYIHETYGK